MLNARSEHRPEAFCGRKGPVKDSTRQLVKHWVHLRNQPKYLKVQQRENLLLSGNIPLQSGCWEGTNAEVTCSYSDLGVWLLKGEYVCRGVWLASRQGGFLEDVLWPVVLDWHHFAYLVPVWDW